MQVQLSRQHDFYSSFVLNRLVCQSHCFVFISYFYFIIHKSTGDSYFVTSQIDISQARPYSRFFTLMQSILMISVFINEPQCQNTTTTITHQNRFIGFEIQSIMTLFPRAFMRYCEHLIREVFFYHYLVIQSFYLYTLIYKSIPFIFNPFFFQTISLPQLFIIAIKSYF